MNVIEPSIELLSSLSGEEILKAIELAGRVCYKSEDRITEVSAKEFVRNILRRGHESVLEHVSLTVRFVCDRGVSHEIVRHRIASYSQESTRYCNYANGELTFIKPCFFHECTERYDMWKELMRDTEITYKLLIYKGATPQEARSVLPNSIKTEVAMTANLREWRHFFKLRCANTAHPQMREVANKALVLMHDRVPIVFDDLFDEFVGG